jgi:16S rRNA C967 or C1407 C5-methylase (RsmB/RsmF family)/NOL1/NOP2/fmu family ribosome biogenesis protein
MNLPKRFSAGLTEKIGEQEFKAFENALDQTPPVSIRINPAKGKDLFPDEEGVPWCSFGRYLKKRPAFVWDPLYHAGAYYAQDASSMFFANAIDFSQDLKVLDLCAAPGGKSSLLLSNLSPNSLLVSNELVGKRAAILYENLVKWGGTNNVITNNRATDFESFKGYFDVVMIDAPCSGEGMFRKDREAVEQWSEGLVNQCSMVQKEILTSAIDLVKEGGLLIYSTCTYENRENEDNIKWLYQNYGRKLEPADVSIANNWGIEKVEIATFNGEVQNGYYCFPHRLKGEGQFIAAMRVVQAPEFKYNGKGLGKTMRPLSKSESAAVSKFVKHDEVNTLFSRNGDMIFAAPESLAKNMSLFIDKMYIKKAGTTVGKLIRDSLIPDHELVMDELASENMPRINLNLEQALDYMQKKNVDVPNDIPNGWIIFTYNGLDIGLAKNLGSRINNHYPAEWRIRKEPKLM